MSTVPSEEFVKVWQTSVNLDEVVQRLGIKRGAAVRRATSFRKHGVPLKKFPSPNGGRERNDYAALAELARSLLPDK